MLRWWPEKGASWAALQSAGEWRGKSPLSYVDATAREEVAYRDNIVADSSEEEAVYSFTTALRREVSFRRVVLESAVFRPRFFEAALGWSIGGCLAYVGP